MSPLQKQIMDAVERGARKANNSYLPEILSLVCMQKLILVRADQYGIEIKPCAR